MSENQVIFEKKVLLDWVCLLWSSHDASSYRKKFDIKDFTEQNIASFLLENHIQK